MEHGQPLGGFPYEHGVLGGQTIPHVFLAGIHSQVLVVVGPRCLHNVLLGSACYFRVTRRTNITILELTVDVSNGFCDIGVQPLDCGPKT